MRHAFLISAVVCLFANSTNAVSAEQAGKLGLEEYKTSKVINLEVSQEQLFKTDSYIVRTSVADLQIAQPVVLCENQFVAVGLSQGTTTFVIWNAKDEVVSMTVHVTDRSNQTLSFTSQTQSQQGDGLTIKEYKVSETMGNYVAQLLSAARSRGVKATSRGQSSATRQTAVPGYLLLVEQEVGPNIRISHGTQKEYEQSLLDKPQCTQIVDMIVSQSRTFRTKNRIAKLTQINPNVLEPVVVSEREVVILGKSPGQATLVLQDVKNNVETIEFNCSRNNLQYSKTSDVTAGPGREKSTIPFVLAKPMNMEEKTALDLVSVAIAHPKCFSTNNELVRATVADEEIAEVVFIESKQIVLAGIAPGRTTVFLWDDKGNIKGLDLIVCASSQTIGERNDSPPAGKELNTTKSLQIKQGVQEIEYWTGCRKDVLTVPRTK